MFIYKKGVNRLHSIVIRREKDGKVYHDITLTRGDSLPIQLSLKKNEEPYTPDPAASIRFAMKSKYTDSDADVVLIKNVPIDTLILEIEPEDTKPLPMKKTYVYDIELTDENGFVDTFIEGKFTIGEEVI